MMKQMLKRTGALLLSLCLTLSVWGVLTPLPTAAATSGDYQYTVNNDNTATITRYLGSGGDVTIPDTLDGHTVTEIGFGAFYGYIGLTSVTIPGSVTVIGSTAFALCIELTSVTIPDSVTMIGDSAFYDCTVLTSIVVGANNSNYSSKDGVLFNKDKTTLIQYALGRSGSYTIPDSVTTIGDSAFYDCTGLNTVDIPNRVTLISRLAFYGCTGLISVNIPNSVTSIGDYAFSDCTELTSVNIPNSVTTVGWHAIYNTGYYNNPANWENGVLYVDNHLIEVNLGELPAVYSIRPGTKTIALRAFSDDHNLSSLTSITIPNSVIKISDGVFWYCTKLTSVFIPGAVTEIGDDAFYGCTSLTDVYYEGSKVDWGKIEIGDENDPLTNANIHYNYQKPSSGNGSSFESYFAKDLQKHFNDLIGEELPVKALIEDGGDISVNWNMFLQAVNSLLDFKLGVDEADFYQAVLLDLMKNTVTSVDYEKEMGKKTTDCIGVIASGLIDKGVEIADANLSSADLDHICDALKAQDMVGDVKLTYDSLKTLLKGCDSAEKCLDRIGSYITAWQEAEHLTAALRLMRQQAALDPNADTLVQCLDEMLQYMSMDQDELIFFCTSDATFWETGTIVKNAICDHLLSLTKHVLPLSGAMDILELMNYSMDALFPTSTSSAQMYRLYALYHIEEITRSSLISANQAYLQDSSDEHAAVLTSCYDMFVRIYDHELKECDALAEMLYKNGIINKVKNFFFADKGEEDISNAKDWINSYQHGLDVIADYKNNAYIEWGLKLNKLQRICLVGITNGKITGYSEHYIETGTSMELPDFSSWCKILNERRAKPKEYHFEGWYYDAACTRPVMGNSVTANGPQIRYSKMTITSGKSVTFRGANDLSLYNAEHQTILRIANGKVVENANNLSVVLDGEKKQIFLPDGLDYSVEITATGSGNMSYSITESADGVSQRQINFYQIAQQIGQSFSGHIGATRNLPQSSYALTTQLGGTAKTILPDEMLETEELNRLNVEVSAVGSGKVSNGTLATKGDCFTVEAMPLSGAPFLGWYVNDVLVSTDVRYSFTVMEDVTLTAKFGEAVLLGDIDGNGKVDVTDALAILRMAVGLSTPTDNADLDGVNGVTVTDALAALRIAVGLA